jgi:hypothetical protein
MFSEVFFTGLYSSLIGFLLAMGAQCYKSKCKEVNFCCIKIIRDVEGEEQLDNATRPNPLSSQSLDRPL